MRNRILLLVCAVCAVAASAGPALAITGDGVADGTGHPYVAYARNTRYSCSASAVSPRLVVTAAHCFAFPDDRVWLRFDPNYRAAGPWPANYLTGTWHANPDWCIACSQGVPGFDTHDIAVIVLDAPLALPRYAKLPAQGLVGGLPNNADVTSVGFGVQDFLTGGGPQQNQRFRNGDRYVAQSKLISSGTIADEFIKLSANASGNENNGGTCFGDSGGPNLKAGTDTILAINSFVNNGLCAGVTYSYRLDTAAAAAFLAPWIAAYGPVQYGS